MLKSFEQLRIRQLQGTRRHIVAVCANDDATKTALQQAEEFADVSNVTAATPEEAAARAVEMIRNGEGDILMKGLIGTDQLLRAVLNKETGLLPQGRIMTHLAMAQIPGYHKILFFTDAAVIPYPTHEQRIQQVRYAVDTCHALGIDKPRIALIHCAEHGGKQFPFVDGYAEIQNMSEKGDFGSCLIDGPIDVKCATSRDALKAKGLQSSLEGDADVLIFPDIEAGNSFYKTLTRFTLTQTAGLLCGPQCPVIVPSRGDTPEAKFNSILFALSTL